MQVGRWNAYADNKYYIRSEGLKMVQYKLSQLVSSASEAQTAQLSGEVVVTSTPEVLQAACIMVRNYSDQFVYIRSYRNIL